jgi:hypothetical protein
MQVAIFHKAAKPLILLERTEQNPSQRDIRSVDDPSFDSRRPVQVILYGQLAARSNSDRRNVANAFLHNNRIRSI